MKIAINNSLSIFTFSHRRFRLDSQNKYNFSSLFIASGVSVTEADYYTYIQMLQLAQLRQDLLDRTGPDLLMINPDMIDYVDLASLGLLVVEKYLDVTQSFSAYSFTLR